MVESGFPAHCSLPADARPHAPLAEGVRVMSNLVGCDLDAVEVGMPVRLRFEDVTPEVTLYRFEPA